MSNNAILSHRWMRKGEPTYKEMEARTASGPGCEKLKKFCEKAREYDVEFAWSDTCCIDKSSSTELDESIRSMFWWYNNSAICIVYLAQSKTIEDIMDNEWTTRGWTLQELLAPEKIKFFNADWIPMTKERNDKSSPETDVMMTLERATGIPHCELFHFTPSPHEVDTRMTWAARRKTTRVEDIAYSLMGIFDVSLQIAYGEGGDRAFCRLIEVIMHAGDPSVLNWSGEVANHPTSSAIPRSPQSYVGHRAVHWDARLEMTMTSLGLRVPVVMFPLNFHSTVDMGNGYFWVTFGSPLCPTMKLGITAKSCVVESAHQFVLGIVNYSLISDGSREVLRIRAKSAGFILSRVTYSLSQDMPSDVVLGVVSPPKHVFEPWRMEIRTGLVEVDFPNIPSRSFPTFYMDRKYLETVYL
ncbi:hypothetical protein K503DRAFT_49268 [Rhizopogon vinicolor AM-OR11-026]|uniref:Heterokaryon incompatibility domain-containing protein n=1 Tax=Rhizopogon vinicolor AM-OR11-026 TaxID=1314800 RepID=A0A1B7N4R4_9AGAM|nr:hypothetical protein K503DRAFT_49268 [Rhizopogon vinicolor AM-OR11-026]